MHCKVTIDMLNPVTRVKEQQTVVQYGEITDIYKYLSNGGSPILKQNENYYRMLSPEICAGGLVCFENSYTDKLYFDCRNKLTAYGTKINANTALPSITLNPKIGMKLTSETVLEPHHYSRTWEFGTTQGNGTIKSLALTHQGAAHAFDYSELSDSFSDTNTETLYDQFTVVGDAATYLTPSNVNVINNTGSLTGSLTQFINNTYLYSFYTSKNYIFCIYEGEHTEAQDYVDITFYIRRLPKRSVDYYASSVDGTYNRASQIPAYLSPEQAYDFTRVLRVYKTDYDDAPIYNQRSSGKAFARSDNSFLAFCSAKLTTEHYSDETPLYSNLKYSKFTFYIFSGDNCDITTYHMSNGCAALTGTSTPTNAVTVAPFVITSDLKIIYWIFHSSVSTTRTVYCRDIQTGTLLWSKYIQAFGNGANKYLASPLNDKNLVAVGQSFRYKRPGTTSTNAAMKFMYLDTNTGDYIGDSIGVVSTDLSSTGSKSDLYENEPNLQLQCEDSPLLLSFINSGNICAALRINYMLARVNLVSPIVKTSDYIMQVKFEIFID